MYTCSDEKTGQFTFEAEGSTDPKSPFYIGKLSWPSANSGVTIGAGYDMKDRSTAEVRRDLVSAGMPVPLAESLSKGGTLTGAKAAAFVKENRDTLVATDLRPLRELFARVYPGYVSRAKERFAHHASSFKSLMKTYGSGYQDAVFFDWESLYPAIRVIAIDFVYQGFGKPQAGSGRPMHFCMANNFDWLINYIQSTPGLSQYEQGRHRAEYLRQWKAFEIARCSQSIEAEVQVR